MVIRFTIDPVLALPPVGYLYPTRKIIIIDDPSTERGLSVRLSDYTRAAAESR
jgi:hypothetical protein